MNGKRLATMMTVLTPVMVMAGALLPASPAQAATCRTAGHAYVVRDGRVFFSGYEGDERFGVPTLSAPSGTQVTVGGNGIAPGGKVILYLLDVNDVLRSVKRVDAQPAQSNCVSNENRWTIDMPRGRYVAYANYNAGNSGALVGERVAFIDVL